jgi:hypothetical protein
MFNRTLCESGGGGCGDVRYGTFSWCCVVLNRAVRWRLSCSRSCLAHALMSYEVNMVGARRRRRMGVGRSFESERINSSKMVGQQIALWRCPSALTTKSRKRSDVPSRAMPTAAIGTQ